MLLELAWSVSSSVGVWSAQVTLRFFGWYSEGLSVFGTPSFICKSEKQCSSSSNVWPAGAIDLAIITLSQERVTGSRSEACCREGMPGHQNLGVSVANLFASRV